MKTKLLKMNNIKDELLNKPLLYGHFIKMVRSRNAKLTYGTFNKIPIKKPKTHTN